jgi:hypothetical protein
MQYTSAKKRAEQHATMGRNTLTVPEGMKFFKIKKPGVYRVDVLPYTVGEHNPHADPGHLHYERTYFVHRNVGPNEEMFVCLRKTHGKDCPICEYRAKLARDPKASEDELKSLEPKERQLFLVIDKDHEDAGVQLWEESYHLFGKFLDNKIKNSDEEDQYENFYHLEDGLTLKIGATEKSFGGRDFCEMSDIEFKARKVPYDADMLAELPCLDDIPAKHKYEDLRKIFLQVDDGDEEETEEDVEVEEDDDDAAAEAARKAKSAAKKPAPATAKKPAPKKPAPAKDEDEDDEWDDEEEVEGTDDEEEEEEEKPAPKKPAPKKPAPAKDEDEDDEWDDEEDEDADADDEEAPALTVGMRVKHPEHGKCKVVHISKDGTSLKLKLADGTIESAVDAEEVTAV